MTYYSGTSKESYDLYSQVNTLSPHVKPMNIHCFDDFILAKAFAYKRAKQDKSIGVIIEITNEENFEKSPYPCYPILIGKLTPKNHTTHLLEDTNFTK